MKYIKLVGSLLMALTLVFGGPMIAEKTAAQTRTGTLSGVVYDGVHKDVTEVRLSLGDQSIRPNANGEFIFTNVPFGTREIKISFPGTDGSEVSLSKLVVVTGEENEVEITLSGELDLVNPSFEEVTSAGNIPGWQARWEWDASKDFQMIGYMTSSTEQAKDGSRSLKMDGSAKTDTASLKYLNYPQPAIPGFLYTASAYFYADVDGEADERQYIRLMVAFFDKDNNNLGRTAVRSTDASNGEWELVTVSAVAPEGAERVALMIDGWSRYEILSYLDDVKLEFSRP